jgi:hypothetical protein
MRRGSSLRLALVDYVPPHFYTFSVTLPTKPYPIVSPQSLKAQERVSWQACKPAD